MFSFSRRGIAYLFNLGLSNQTAVVEGADIKTKAVSHLSNFHVLRENRKCMPFSRAV